ncbi:hypothetical protein [Marinicellulosiphila megalodicopiae]|uniref:hypothetical protein n=1 Tax=Marinicellulosiphila megalodicopiae TaxID=2724896 RepID=UPI003BAECF24
MMLVIKLLTTPILIALLTLIKNRYGNNIAGLFMGFPLIAGPITLFLYFEQGVDFALSSSYYTLWGVLGVSIFCLTYCWCAIKFNLYGSLILSLIGYGLFSYLFSNISLPAWQSFLIILMGLVICIFLSPQLIIKKQTKIKTKKTVSIEIWLRMCFSVMLVFMVTAIAPHVGETFSGILAVFPIATITMAVFTHMESKASVILLLRSLMFGLISLSFFYFSLLILASTINFIPSMLIALMISIAIQFLSLRISKKILIKKVH